MSQIIHDPHIANPLIQKSREQEKNIDKENFFNKFRMKRPARIPAAAKPVLAALAVFVGTMWGILLFLSSFIFNLLAETFRFLSRWLPSRRY